MSVCAIFFAVSLPVVDFATNSIAQRISGADPTICLSRFDDYPPSKGKLGFPRCLFQDPFPLNTKFWLRGVDFSCVSPWNDEGGAIRAGTAISKRHVVCAAHLPLWKGVRILFVGEDGGVCPCYVEKTKTVGKTDIMVASLNAELTPNIKPAKILPEDYEKYIGDGKGLPIVTFNQREQVFLSQANSICSNHVWHAAAKNVSWKALSGKIVGGDSGDPAFLLIGDEPILLYCLHYGGFGSGPPLHHYRKEIQKAMDDLCPGYKLEMFNFRKVGL